MHISEGVLHAPTILSFGAVAVAGTAIGLKKLNLDQIMPAALLTATFFVASLIHIRLGPGSIHLILNGLLGILLGWSAFPAILVALILQAVFFQFGGITVLGVNTVVMALPAVIVYYLARRWLKKGGRQCATAAFASGFCSILLSSLLMIFALVSSNQHFLKSGLLILAAQAPLMIVEGVITLFIVLFIAKVQPELLETTQ